MRLLPCLCFSCAAIHPAHSVLVLAGIGKVVNIIEELKVQINSNITNGWLAISQKYRKNFRLLPPAIF